MSDGPVRTEVRGDGRILVITLDRPGVRNAIDPELAKGVAAALERLDADASLRVAVLTGANSTFCSGMDLSAFCDATPAEAAATLDLLVKHRTGKPLIAALEGHALGGGLELALTCDLIVAAEDAQLGLPEVRWSLVPSGGGLLRLPGLLPPQVAMEMALTGEAQSGVRLHGLGLVAQLAPPGGALDAALELAARIAANGPLAVEASKSLVRDSRQRGDQDELWARQEEICERVNASGDAREGVAAFLARRDPEFRGD